MWWHILITQIDDTKRCHKEVKQSKKQSDENKWYKVLTHVDEIKWRHKEIRQSNETK